MVVLIRLVGYLLYIYATDLFCIFCLFLLYRCWLWFFFFCFLLRRPSLSILPRVYEWAVTDLLVWHCWIFSKKTRYRVQTAPNRIYVYAYYYRQSIYLDCLSIFLYVLDFFFFIWRCPWCRSSISYSLSDHIIPVWFFVVDSILFFYFHTQILLQRLLAAFPLCIYAGCWCHRQLELKEQQQSTPTSASDVHSALMAAIPIHTRTTRLDCVCV